MCQFYLLLLLNRFSCVGLCNPVDGCPLGSADPGILQARILERVASFLLQGTFPTQGSNPRLLCWKVNSLPLSHLGSQHSQTAAAAAKLLQSCPTLCNPRDSSPPGSPVPGILQSRRLEWVAISFSNA